MILTLATKELRAMFFSPMAWVVLAVLQFIFGTFFWLGMDQYFMEMSQAVRPEIRLGVTEVVGSKVFQIASFVMLFAVPMISIRQLSDERRQQTLPFLFSAPISMTEIVVAKFVALVAFLSVALLIILSMICTLNLWTDLDFGFMWSNVLGLWLLVAAFSSLGLFMSSLTQQPIIAAVLTFVALFLLMTLDYYFANDPTSVVTYFSLIGHFEGFSRGVISSRDLGYFVLFIFTFLVLTIRRLDADRLRG